MTKVIQTAIKNLCPLGVRVGCGHCKALLETDDDTRIEAEYVYNDYQYQGWDEGYKFNCPVCGKLIYLITNRGQ